MHDEKVDPPDDRSGSTEQDLPFDADTDPAPAGVDGKLDVIPGPGGYAGRDPKTEMPRMPSIPETQDDPLTHDAAPDDKERPANK
jgi:hypothetical protein